MWYKINGVWRSEEYINAGYINFKEAFSPCINIYEFTKTRYIDGLIRLGIITDVANYLTVIDFLKNKQFVSGVAFYKNLHPGTPLIDCKHMVLKIQEDMNKYKLRGRDKNDHRNSGKS